MHKSMLIETHMVRNRCTHTHFPSRIQSQIRLIKPTAVVLGTSKTGPDLHTTIKTHDTHTQTHYTPVKDSLLSVLLNKGY